MKLLFDEDLVESVVFVCTARRRENIPSLQVARFHREREKLYAILDPDERNAAFFDLHLGWFREWGMETALRDVAAKFPLLEQHLDGLVFRKARARTDEGAELFVSGDEGRNAVVALRAERFAAPDALTKFLNHELQHISDMVDPAFGYSPNVAVHAGLGSQQRVIRERYRLQWDVTIDGRLHQRAWPTEATRKSRLAEFVNAFSFREDRDALFAQLWNNPRPLHEDLVALASDPRRIKNTGRAPGAPCPLCGFPTFDWANVEDARRETITAIQREFPSWDEHDSACARCVEVYDSARLLAQTAC